MKYEKIKRGVFISRPNRFLAEVEIDGEKHICHVKNTGRCKELLVSGAVVYLDEPSNPDRKTKYDLVAVEKGDLLINMDSQAPNKVIYEWISSGNFFKNIVKIKLETVFSNSRFDLYVETVDEKIFSEVKGVTLEYDGVAMFPDAPTERGIKHLNELIIAAEQGYKSYVFFVVQMERCKYFTPNETTHPEFAEALRRAKESGVNVIALNCSVTSDELNIKDFVEVRL